MRLRLRKAGGPPAPSSRDDDARGPLLRDRVRSLVATKRAATAARTLMTGIAIGVAVGILIGAALAAVMLARKGTDHV